MEIDCTSYSEHSFPAELLSTFSFIFFWCNSSYNLSVHICSCKGPRFMKVPLLASRLYSLKSSFKRITLNKDHEISWRQTQHGMLCLYSQL